MEPELPAFTDPHACSPKEEPDTRCTSMPIAVPHPVGMTLAVKSGAPTTAYVAALVIAPAPVSAVYTTAEHGCPDVTAAVTLPCNECSEAAVTPPDAVSTGGTYPFPETTTGAVILVADWIPPDTLMKPGCTVPGDRNTLPASGEAAVIMPEVTVAVPYATTTRPTARYPESATGVVCVPVVAAMPAFA